VLGCWGGITDCSSYTIKSAPPRMFLSALIFLLSCQGPWFCSFQSLCGFERPGSHVCRVGQNLIYMHWNDRIFDETPAKNTIDTPCNLMFWSRSSFAKRLIIAVLYEIRCETGNTSGDKPQGMVSCSAWLIFIWPFLRLFLLCILMLWWSCVMQRI